jgi:hypothetical protein
MLNKIRQNIINKILYNTLKIISLLFLILQLLNKILYFLNF